MSRTLQGVVFPQSNETPSEEEAKLKQALLYRDSKVQELMRLEAEHKASEEKLNKLKRESAALMEGNRELQTQVSDKLGPQATDKPEPVLRLEEKLKGLAEKNAVLRRVFMSLIIESGVNWAKDAKLMDLMMIMEHSPAVAWNGGLSDAGREPSVSASPGGMRA